MKPSRHVVSAIVLLGMAAIAAWNASNNGDWTDPVVPVVSGLAVIWFVAGLGLLSGTAVGVWLGRLGAVALLILGAYFGWDQIVVYDGAESWRGIALLITVPLTALLVGAGIGILVALRSGAGRHASTRGPQGSGA